MSVVSTIGAAATRSGWSLGVAPQFATMGLHEVGAPASEVGGQPATSSARSSASSASCAFSAFRSSSVEARRSCRRLPRWSR
jgi:hypothetical protein